MLRRCDKTHEPLNWGTMGMCPLIPVNERRRNRQSQGALRSKKQYERGMMSKTAANFRGNCGDPQTIPCSAKLVYRSPAMMM